MCTSKLFRWFVLALLFSFCNPVSAGVEAPSPEALKNEALSELALLESNLVDQPKLQKIVIHARTALESTTPLFLSPYHIIDVSVFDHFKAVTEDMKQLVKKMYKQELPNRNQLGTIAHQIARDKILLASILLVDTAVNDLRTLLGPEAKELAEVLKEIETAQKALQKKDEQLLKYGIDWLSYKQAVQHYKSAYKQAWAKIKEITKLAYHLEEKLSHLVQETQKDLTKLSDKPYKADKYDKKLYKIAKKLNQQISDLEQAVSAELANIAANLGLPVDTVLAVLKNITGLMAKFNLQSALAEIIETLNQAIKPETSDSTKEIVALAIDSLHRMEVYFRVPPAKFIKVSRDKVGLINTFLLESFVTRVLDYNNNPLHSQAVIYTVTQGTGRFLDPPTVLSDALNSWPNSGGASGASSNSEPGATFPSVFPFLEATGKSFTLPDNHPYFPNLTVTSSEEIHIFIEALSTNTVSFFIKPISATSTESTITITGLDPFWNPGNPISLYRHQDGVFVEQFQVDQGKYTWVQDISTAHHIHILPGKSTLQIGLEILGQPVPPWYYNYYDYYPITKTYTLKANLYDSINIVADQLTLDGKGYFIAPAFGPAIAMPNRFEVTIKRCIAWNSIDIVSGSQNTIISNTLYANLNLVSTSQINVIGNTMNSPGVGVMLVMEPSFITIDDNIFYDSLAGIAYLGWVGQPCHDITVTNNTIHSSNAGIGINYGYNITLTDNAVSSNEEWFGVYLANCDNNFISGNTITENNYGLYLAGSTNSVVFHNNIWGSRYYNVSSITTPWLAMPPLDPTTQPTQLIDLSYQGQGNFWGRTTKPGFMPKVDSHSESVIDRYPYLIEDGWLKGEAPAPLEFTHTATVLTDEQGYATAWPFKFGSVAEDNFITATVSGTNLSVFFRATSTPYPPPPELQLLSPRATNDPSPELFGTSEPNYIIRISALGGTLVITTTANSEGEWSVDLPALPEGTHSLLIEAFPVEGPVTDYFVVTIRIDITPPVITIDYPIEGIILGDISQIYGEISYSDGESGINPESLEVLLNGQDITRVFDKATNYATYHPRYDTWEELNKCVTVGQISVDGVNELIVKIVDNAGNSQEQVRHFTVVQETMEVPFGFGKHIEAWGESADWYNPIHIIIVQTSEPYSPTGLTDSRSYVGDTTQGTFVFSYTDVLEVVIEIERTIMIDNITRSISYSGTTVTTLQEIFEPLPSPMGQGPIALSMDFSHWVTVAFNSPRFQCGGPKKMIYVTDKTEGQQKDRAIPTQDDDEDPLTHDMTMEQSEQWLEDWLAEDAHKDVNPSDIKVVGPGVDDYNCHGYTFTCGQKWLNSRDDIPGFDKKVKLLSRIINHNDYESHPLLAKKNDVVAFVDRKTRKIVHTGVVIRRGDYYGILIISKWGPGPLIESTLVAAQAEKEYADCDIFFYRTERKEDDDTKEKHTLRQEPLKCGCLGWEALVLVFIIMFIKRRQKKRGVAL